MRITKEEMKWLSQFESNFRTAAKAQPYTTRIPFDAAMRMNDIRERLSGKRLYINASCPPCIIELLRDVGDAYNKQLAAGPDADITETEAAKKPRTRRARTRKTDA